MSVGPGTQIGGYRIDAPAGAGGMGQVYRATDTRLNRTVAVKFLTQALGDDDARERFRREVRAVSSLNHPHIVTVHEAGEFEGREYLVTEFVDGGTLGSWARAERRSWRQVVDLLVGVADGLAAAHDAGILHRDIKPDNILVAKNGYAKLADFGLAKQTGDPGAHTRTMQDTPTRRGVILGTLDYMSPEQAKGAAVDARSDVFSFGALLYELLSGRRPFTGDTDLHVIDAVLHRSPEPLGDDTPAALRGVVEKALEKDPADRYQSMRDLVVDLRRLARHTADTPLPIVRERRSLAMPVVASVVVVVVLAAGAAAWWRMRPDTVTVADAAPIRSIAVLPLQNLSGDANEDYFSDGMTEELISKIAQVHALRVISRTSVMRYKSSDKKLPEIGRELGVDAIIEGSVRRSGGRVRVTAQLIRAESDTHLWARDFDGESADVLMMQADIADAIVRELRVQITPDESRRLTAAARVNPAAHDIFMLGKYHLWQGNYSSWQQSIKEFEEAIRLQPDYAPAHAELSMAWSGGRSVNYTREEGAMRTAAAKALALDPMLAEAHAALAQVRFEDWDWEGTLTAYAEAFRLNPDSVDVCGCFVNVLVALGRFADAERIGAHGVSVNPLSTDMRFNRGFTLFIMRRYVEAEQQLLRAIDLEPKHLGAHVVLSLVYQMMGRLDDALKVIERPEVPFGLRGVVYAKLGRRQEALKAIAATGDSSPTGTAQIYVALGDKDRAFEWFSKAIDERQGFARWLKFTPEVDPLRSDPRFPALIARLKLPPSPPASQ